MTRLKYLLSDSRWNWFARGLPSLARARTLFLARNATMTSFQRCASLWQLTGQLLKRNVPGALVECGVWRGGSAGIMGCASRHAGKTRPLHLFDSFEGLPEPGPEDGSYAVDYSGGKAEGRLATIAKCDAGLETVRAHLFQRLQLNPAHVHFHVGWFQDTVPGDAKVIGPIAILRLDGDWYASTQIC